MSNKRIAPVSPPKTRHHLPPFDEFPVRVELRFRTAAEKDAFMGGLSDGFGEGWCDLDWEDPARPVNPYLPSSGFRKATRFCVTPIDPTA